MHQIELLGNRNEAAAESCSNSEDETPISQQARTSCRAKHGKKTAKVTRLLAQLFNPIFSLLFYFD